MSVFIINTDSSSLFYEQTTQIEGFEYLLRFMWSDREARWYLSIYDQDENPIALGIGLKVTWPLLRRFLDPRLPPGLLMCVDTSGQNLDCQQPSDLGSRVLLEYTTSDDEIFQSG